VRGGWSPGAAQEHSVRPPQGPARAERRAANATHRKRYLEKLDADGDEKISEAKKCGRRDA